MFDYRNKKVLITGASGDIGSSIARSLHSSGSIVTLSGTRESILSKFGLKKITQGYSSFSSGDERKAAP